MAASWPPASGAVGRGSIETDAAERGDLQCGARQIDARDGTHEVNFKAASCAEGEPRKAVEGEVKIAPVVGNPQRDRAFRIVATRRVRRQYGVEARNGVEHMGD